MYKTTFLRFAVSTFIGLYFTSLSVRGQTWTQAIRLKDFGISPGNYSGITNIGGGLYAVADDKKEGCGFHVWYIEQDLQNGMVEKVTNIGLTKTDIISTKRDAEGIAFVKEDSTIWVSGEADQRVLAFCLDGTECGRELRIPSFAGQKNIKANYGFEALCYDTINKVFWTITENTLPADGMPVTAGDTVGARLRLLSFDNNGVFRTAYNYCTETPNAKDGQRGYAFGVVALCSVYSGRLWIMEREVNIPKHRLRARSVIKIFEIDPLGGDIKVGGELRKHKVAELTTCMRLIRPRLANYEGLCEGATLRDGRRTWLLVSDSQGGAGNKICRLRDWIIALVE